MKRYSLIVALHIIGIAFLSVGVYLLVDAGLTPRDALQAATRSSQGS